MGKGTGKMMQEPLLESLGLNLQPPQFSLSQLSGWSGEDSKDQSLKESRLTKEEKKTAKDGQPIVKKNLRPTSSCYYFKDESQQAQVSSTGSTQGLLGEIVSDGIKKTHSNGQVDGSLEIQDGTKSAQPLGESIEIPKPDFGPFVRVNIPGDSPIASTRSRSSEFFQSAAESRESLVPTYRRPVNVGMNVGLAFSPFEDLAPPHASYKSSKPNNDHKTSGKRWEASGLKNLNKGEEDFPKLVALEGNFPSSAKRPAREKFSIEGNRSPNDRKRKTKKGYKK